MVIPYITVEIFQKLWYNKGIKGREASLIVREIFMTFNNKKKGEVTTAEATTESDATIWGDFIKPLILCSVFGLLLGFLIPKFIGGVNIVQGSSMEPSFSDGDIVLVSCNTRDLERGDVVVFSTWERDESKDKEDSIRIKRIIGMPGDVIEVDKKTSTVTINGEPLYEPYINTGYSRAYDITWPATVPEGHYFVMGDNRPHSLDSRSKEIGFVAADEIIYKVGPILWPLLR